jgi:2-polyprenyl-3-methyl-5-hydroxy-6-metoxy-1,4-benzoquinol methylase
LANVLDSSRADVQKLASCPVCAGLRLAHVFTVPDVLHPHGELRLERCCSCGIVVLNPRLAPRATLAVEDASTFYAMTDSEIDALLRELDRLVEGLENSVVRRGTLLDIGCNRGLLLEAARRRGWSVVGVELSSVAAERARLDFGLTVHGTLDELRGQTFDLIVGWHVLEHTPDAGAFLRHAAQFLEIDGIMALQVPSFAALGAFVERSMFTSLVCAVHNFYFEPATLANVIAAAGLTVVELREDDIMLTATCVRAPSDGRGSLERQPPAGE